MSVSRIIGFTSVCAEWTLVCVIPCIVLLIMINFIVDIPECLPTKRENDQDYHQDDKTTNDDELIFFNNFIFTSNHDLSMLRVFAPVFSLTNEV